MREKVFFVPPFIDRRKAMSPEAREAFEEVLISQLAKNTEPDKAQQIAWLAAKRILLAGEFA